MARTERRRLPGWRAEELRTTLWLVPAVCVVVASGLFVLTYNLDEAVYHGSLQLPWWIRTGTADAGREVLIGIAAAVITVIGLVFSITIVALTLASQQFGPRMLRSFIRDFGMQLSLGLFVGSFVFTALALGSITTQGTAEFVPHVSITVAEIMMVGDVGVLIYFIHHIARTIQLPEVIARVAADLGRAIDESFPQAVQAVPDAAGGWVGSAREPAAPVAAPGDGEPSEEELNARLDAEGVTVAATRSGYLQFVGYGQLVDIASEADAVVRFAYRVGHFVVAGRPLAVVWPPHAAAEVAKALTQAHITGPYRTLAQDPVFPIDQLAEIAIRALSPAVNDTFTALTCIDWLSDGLSKISGRAISEGTYRDRRGRIRLIEFGQSYERMVNRAFDKIRQSCRAQPAVIIRVLDALANVAEYTTSAEQRTSITRQADMVLREAEGSVAEDNDRQDIARRYERITATCKRLDAGEAAPRVWRVAR